jgi:hypothetical protein
MLDDRAPPPWRIPGTQDYLRIRPATAALWRALALSPAELFREARGVQGAPFDVQAVSFDVIMRRLVVRAMLGEIKATKLIADLIEGRPGLRRNHNESDDPACRQRVQAATETLVRFMVERATDASTIGPDDALRDNPR